jgi:hypothetical protein
MLLALLARCWHHWQVISTFLFFLIIFVNKLGKQPIIIPVLDTIIARELAPLFLSHVIRHISILETIVSDRGP